jgi:predicted N-formylglutamate amidohydrolase
MMFRMNEFSDTSPDSGHAPGGGEATDAAPYEVLNADGAAPILLVCDHAANALPAHYNMLGLEPDLLSRHIAWDIGAADLTRRLSASLDAPAVLSCYSRLLIDCNRLPGHVTSIPEVSDHIPIPGNVDLSVAEAEVRQARYFEPFHDAVDRLLAGFARRRIVPAYVAIHSFTPVMNGIERPWHVGILWNRDPRLALPLIDALRAFPDLTVGDNQPYSGRDPEGYSIHVHGGDRGVPNVLIEVRQDLIDTHHGAEAWSARLAHVIGGVVRDGAPYRIEKH